MFNDLDFVKETVSNIPAVKLNKKRVWSKENFETFNKNSSYAFKLIFQEKEIITFALLQWVIIAFMYYVWVQILGWIPESVWNDKSKLADLPLNIAFLGWSFLYVGLATYPISILSGCMGASHFLKQQGLRSTIAGCLKIVLSKTGSLWSYYWIDGWITVNQILNRLPKKGEGGIYGAKKAINELLYYSWKIGSIAMLPSILAGKNLFAAAKESVNLVIKNPINVMLLRGGYSLFCWIIGIATYIGAIFFYLSNNHLFESKSVIFTFYFWMGIPIVISVGIIELLIKPVFVILSCKLYSDYVKAENINIFLPKPTSKTVNILVVFIILIVIVSVIYLLREQIFYIPQIYEKYVVSSYLTNDIKLFRPCFSLIAVLLIK